MCDCRFTQPSATLGLVMGDPFLGPGAFPEQGSRRAPCFGVWTNPASPPRSPSYCAQCYFPTASWGVSPTSHHPAVGGAVREHHQTPVGAWLVVSTARSLQQEALLCEPTRSPSSGGYVLFVFVQPVFLKGHSFTKLTNAPTERRPPQ